MAGPDIDLNAAARIDDAIAATGASTVDFDVQTRPPKGLAEGMNSLMGGPSPVQFVFTVEPDALDVDSPERADAPAGPSDEDGGYGFIRPSAEADDADVDDAIVSFLAEYVDAAEGFGPVDPDLDPEDHVRAALGQMDSVDDADRLWSDVQARIDG